MLACARLGAVHAVVFGGFVPHELAARIDDCTARIVLTTSCGIEPSRIVAYKPILDEAMAKSEAQPTRCIVKQRPQVEAVLAIGARPRLGHAEIAIAAPAPWVDVASTDPL